MAGNSSDLSFIKRTLKNSSAGTFAGIAGCLVGHPFDTLKVRLQTQPIKNPIYNGLIDCFLKTIKWEGVGGLYKGVGSPILGQMFFRATMFASYYQFTSHLAGEENVGHRLKDIHYYLAGFLTGSVISFVEGPIDLFKTKMQIQIIRAKSGGKIQYKNVFHAGYVIIRNHGFHACYQGLLPTIMRDAPGFSVYFGTYEFFKTHFTPKHMSPSDPPSWVIFLGASTGGMLFWVITYPIDVIKSTIQSDESEISKRKFKGVKDCAKRLYFEEGGWKRFFKGFTPCLMRAIPANVTMLWTVEKTRNIFNSIF